MANRIWDLRDRIDVLHELLELRGARRSAKLHVVGHGVGDRGVAAEIAADDHPDGGRSYPARGAGRMYRRRLVNGMIRSRPGRSASAAPLLAAVACALVLILTGCSRSSGTAVAARPSSGPEYTLMQMNLCLSGVAGCYMKVKYPAGVEEAVARVREAHPDAVTVNEVCSRDAGLIARRAGYHLRFSRVIYHNKPLACVRPGGRGLFGDAVLTKAAIERTDSHAFEAQAGPEQRQWICVDTRNGVEVCSAHLASQETDEVAANDPQCVELRALLARRASARVVIFGGDVNRLASCAPRGFWTRTDESARQSPGGQQVYGIDAFRSPSARVEPATHTDHDVLLIRAYLTAPR